MCKWFQIGESGKSTRQLEKTVALLKKVVERVQSENEQLKKAPGVVSNERLQNLQMENEGLKVRIILLLLLIFFSDTDYRNVNELLKISRERLWPSG
jgi:hypothetical protein